MKLRALMVAAALGATVLSAVPVLLTAEAAYACDYQTSCDNEQEEPEPDPADDPGPGGGGSDEGTPGPDGVITLEQVTIIGQRELIDPPPAPSVLPGGGGGGGGGGTPGVTPSGKARTELRKEKCYRNNSPYTVKETEQFAYTTSYQVSANISASASAMLSAQLGVQFNVGTTKTYTTEVTLAPGQGFGIYVEYETRDYQVTTANWMGTTTTESVSVTAPTGTTVGGAC